MMAWLMRWWHPVRKTKLKPNVTPPPPRGVNPAFQVPQTPRVVTVSAVGGGGGGGLPMSGGGGGSGGVFIHNLTPAFQTPPPDELVCYHTLLQAHDDLQMYGVLQNETKDRIRKIIQGDWT